MYYYCFNNIIFLSFYHLLGTSIVSTLEIPKTILQFWRKSVLCPVQQNSKPRFLISLSNSTEWVTNLTNHGIYHLWTLYIMRKYIFMLRPKLIFIFCYLQLKASWINISQNVCLNILIFYANTSKWMWNRGSGKKQTMNDNAKRNEALRGTNMQKQRWLITVFIIEGKSNK